MNDFEGVPLTPNVARLIAEELFRKQSLWKRDALASAIQEAHKARGGVRGQQNAVAAVKKALSNLLTDGLVENHHYGHWRWIGVRSESPDEASPVTEASTQSADEDEEASLAEETLGSGPEAVYLYFNPNDRKLASLEGRETWECKIGRTAITDAAIRIFSQGAKTAQSHAPVVGLVIKTTDAAALERALHAALRLVDAQVPDSPGVEWFMTSPERVEGWYARFQHSLAALKS